MHSLFAVATFSILKGRWRPYTKGKFVSPKYTLNSRGSKIDVWMQKGRVRTSHGNPGKSWNFRISFSWFIMENHENEVHCTKHFQQLVLLLVLLLLFFFRKWKSKERKFSGSPNGSSSQFLRRKDQIKVMENVERSCLEKPGMFKF